MFEKFSYDEKGGNNPKREEIPPKRYDIKIAQFRIQRVRGDLIGVYKICHKIYDPSTTKTTGTLL